MKLTNSVKGKSRIWERSNISKTPAFWIWCLDCWSKRGLCLNVGLAGQRELGRPPLFLILCRRVEKNLSYNLPPKFRYPGKDWGADDMNDVGTPLDGQMSPPGHDARDEMA